MSTWSEIIEKLVYIMDDCKKALSEKGLTVSGQVNLCNVDECINKVLNSERYTVTSTLKHNLDDYSSLIPNDLTNVKNALNNKGVYSTSGLKISQIPDKIREIEILLSDPYAGDINDFRVFYGKNDPKNVYFTDKKPPSNVTIYDWSKNKDKSVIMYMDSDNMYVTSRRENLKVILPSSIENMFNYYGTYKLESVDFSMADFSLVTNMNGIFRESSSLKTVKADNIDVSNVTTMNSAFERCTSLISLDLSTWNTERLEYCDALFFQCSNLRTLKLNFNTRNLKYAGSMFYNCSSLTTLDLRSFDLSYMRDSGAAESGIHAMFGNCTNLRTIIAKNWADNSYIASQSSVFLNCSSLSGYSSGKISGEYAKSTSRGGYFTSP